MIRNRPVQILTMARSGSTAYLQYRVITDGYRCINTSDADIVNHDFPMLSSFPEFILNKNILLNNNSSVDNKLDLLEYKKEKGEHFCNKTFISEDIPFSSNKLLHYLNSYEVHILIRDPFAKFISHMYQNYNDWKVSNIFDRPVKMPDNNNEYEHNNPSYFVCANDDIIPWMDDYIRFNERVNWLCKHGSFHYKIVQHETIRKKYTLDTDLPFPISLNFDYEELCINYHEIKKEFYKKLHIAEEEIK